jgi:predicted nuclease of restriction endonuclease-like (RecB) superfamily
MKNLVSEIRFIIESARANAVRSVDFCRVQMYWQIGRRIVEEEQGGQARAEYGKSLIKNLAQEIEPEYGSGFGQRQLERARQFYIEFPIASTLRTQFNWSQYKLLIAISDKDKREYYELEAASNCWTARQMQRQINSMLYERLLLSNDKESVLAMARKEKKPEKTQEIVKDPMVLEFLGLEKKAHYYESDLETELINHLQEFILELGNGFTFVARQKRVLLEDDEFFIDLVFYNRVARRFVIFELKTGEVTHQDLGQLQMYVNYYDRIEKLPDENPTIGILLCTAKNDTLVKMTLPADNNTIVASKYQLYLPTEQQLIAEVEKVKKEWEESR